MMSHTKAIFWIPVLLATAYYATPLVVSPGEYGFWVLVLLPALLSLAFLPLRHTRPLLVAGIGLACLAISPAAIGAVLGSVASLAKNGASTGGRYAASGLSAAAVTVKAGHLTVVGWTGVATIEMVISTALIIIAALVGWLFHAVTESRGAREEMEEYRAQQIRMAERARIAREMHDVVAHRISLVAMMSGALAYREDLPTDARDAAKIIQDNSRQALEELRAVLTDLRATDDPEAPQPTLTHLPALLTDSEDTGTAVDMQLDLPVEQVPLRHSRHLYRILQEGLINARRHAPGQTVTVQLSGEPAVGITLRMSNPPGAGPDDPGTGYGLVGIEERARLLGGEARTHREDGRFTLEVNVPWRVG